MRHLLAIKSGRHPHEVLVLMATVVVGTIGIFLPHSISKSVTALFDVLGAQLFFAGMFVFSIIGLYALYVAKVKGLLIERGALIGLSFFYLLYSLAVLTSAGLSGLIGSILPLSFVIANICRVIQINRDLNSIKEYLNAN